jgi:hypothetical protein
MKRPPTFRDREKTAGALVFTLRVEDPDRQEAEPNLYPIICPTYVWNPLRKQHTPSPPKKRNVLFHESMHS